MAKSKLLVNMSKFFSTPVLLIGFNRPDTMQQVFEAVRKAKPAKLYYAVDGARPGKDEDEKVKQVQNIINEVDWKCDLHTLFREENMGCGWGPANAISWAFETTDRLIVLEDDCVPSQSFFRFCDEMLEMYKEDTRINIISGRSHLHGTSFFDKQDYIFTHYAHTWGWATWKRCWLNFDMYMSDVPAFLEQGGALNILPTDEQGIRANKNLEKKYKEIQREVTHSWDSQWSYARLKTGLGIVPAHNLIHNIGNVGTHSNTKLNKDMLAEEMPDVLRHPCFVMPCREYEIAHYKTHIKRQNCLIRKVYSMICRELRSLFGYER